MALDPPTPEPAAPAKTPHRYRGKVKNPKTGCNPFQQRWAELYAGSNDGHAAYRAVEQEMNLVPRTDHVMRRHCQRLRDSARVQAYLEKCKKVVGRYFPGGVIPTWLGEAYKTNHTYQHAAELKHKAKEYFAAKEAEGGMIELNALCKYLGVSWATLYKYAERGEEWWEAVNDIKTWCAAYITDLMLRDPKLSHTGNYILNRMDIPEHPAQAARHRAEIERIKAETTAIKEGRGLGPGGPAVILVSVESDGQVRQINSRTVPPRALPVTEADAHG